MENCTRPLLRYHGGKWRIAPWIISFFPKHRIYTEPFCGAGSVFMRKERCYAEIINDLDGEIVNLFKQVRDNGSELARVLFYTSFSRKELLLSYQKSDDCLEQARRTVVRSLLGFGSNSHAKNTGFRCNSNRSSTTPAHDFANYPFALKNIINRLRGVVVENKDFESIMMQHDSDSTLHYLDPPYVKSTRGVGNDYNYEMSDDDHVRMIEVAKLMKGCVIISGYNNDLYRDSLSSWCRFDRETFADGSRKRIESVWVKKDFVEKNLFTLATNH